MRELTIDENSAGQRLDRFLGKYMTKAPASFFYRMMRRKNIVLNGKKCEGTERLQTGDVVKLFLADETIDQFREPVRVAACETNAGGSRRVTTARADAVAGANVGENRRVTAAGADTAAGAGTAHGTVSVDRRKTGRISLNVIYEDKDILLVNKPAGMLSQKAAASDVSLTEHLISWLLESGKITETQLETFRPSVCNRLDRNTSGLVICGKTLRGSQAMSALLRERTLDKRYLCLAAGVLRGEQRIEGWLKKDEKANQVTILSKPAPETTPIVTVYRHLLDNDRVTLLEVELVTGKSHQIRAHLASIGHPVIGDSKYGDKEVNQEFSRRYGLRVQLLHAWKIRFPNVPDEPERQSGGRFSETQERQSDGRSAEILERLSGRQFTATVPPVMKRILTGEGLWLPGIQED